MSFENGYNAKDYIAGCMDKYKADSLIFHKALQMIDFFVKLPQFPHNYSQMCKALGLILNCNFEEFLRFMGQYLFAESNKEMRDIDWSYTNDAFVQEATAFFIAVNGVTFMANESRISSGKIYEILCSKASSDSKNGIFKFVRMDGSSFEFEMTLADIQRLSTVMEEIFYKA